MIKQLKSLPPGMRTYTLIWSGQLASIIGSSMTDFALAVWILTTTGSVTSFSIVMMLAILPGILVSLVSGVLVDRWDRRRTLIVSDSISAVATLVVALLFLTGRLEFWHICIAATVGSSTRAFQLPAWGATTPLLVPAEHLGRASGMMNFARSAGQIIGPAAGAALVGVIGLGGILLNNVVTFLIAMTTLLIARFPAVPKTAGAQAVRGSVLREAAFGWQYIWARPALRAHLFFFTLVNFCLSYALVLFPPMVLGFADVRGLGFVSAMVGVGMLLGSIYVTATGGPERQVASMLAVGVVASVCLATMGLRPWAWLVGLSLFVLCFGIPILNGSFMRIWQPRIAPDVLGRTVAAMQVMAWSAQPLAFLTGGILADRVFVPMLMPGGALAGSLGTVFGVGPGRGIGLMLLLSGMILIVGTVVGIMMPAFRQAEEIPLATAPPQQPAAPAPEPEIAAEGGGTAVPA